MSWTVRIDHSWKPAHQFVKWRTTSRWRTKCHTTECTHNTFLLLQKHLTCSTELILIGWKIVPNEEHVQCDDRFASCKRTLAFVTTFRQKSSESARHNCTMWALSCTTFSGLLWNTSSFKNPHKNKSHGLISVWYDISCATLYVHPLDKFCCATHWSPYCANILLKFKIF
jgi:hypothetical protein